MPLSQGFEPVMGLEPITYALQERCAANCATPAESPGQPTEAAAIRPRAGHTRWWLTSDPRGDSAACRRRGIGDGRIGASISERLFVDTFGEALRQKRSERGLSLRGLSELVGFSHVYIHEVERGSKRASVEFAERCDRVLRAGGRLRARAVTPESSRAPIRQVRIPNRLWDKVKARAEAEGRTIDQVINTCLREGL